MKAVQMQTTGSPDVLKLVEVPMPEVRQGELLVKVHIAGVNYADLVRRSGKRYPRPTPLPFVIGCEFAGVVTKVGAGVTQYKEGDRVLAVVDSGGYAEYAIVPEMQVLPVAPGLSFETAVALFIQGLTAHCALVETGNFKAGQSVFIEGGVGGVGGLAVQIANLLGAKRVVAGVGNPSKFEAAKALGAHAAVDYTQPEWYKGARTAGGGDGFELALHMRGGEDLNNCMRLLVEFGRVVVFGAASGAKSAVEGEALLGVMSDIAPNTGVLGCYLGGWLMRPEFVHRAWSQLVKWSLSGELKCAIGKVFPLDQAAHAHEFMSSRQSTGKILLKA